MIHRRPLLVAHAGCMNTAPNSLESIDAARAAGAQAVEFDVQSTADGYPLLTHDPRVRLPDGRTPATRELRYADLEYGRWIADDAMRPPASLEQVLARCRDLGLLLNLDIKDLQALPRVSEAVTAHRSCVFFTGIPVHRLATLDRSVPGSVLVNLPERIRPGSLTEILDTVVRWGAQGINLDFRALSTELLETARSRMLTVAAWTVDGVPDIVRTIEFDVDVITSSYPDRVRSILTEQNVRV